MSTSKIAVALTAAFVASTASVWPGPRADAKHAGETHITAALPGLRVAPPAEVAKAWPPAAVRPILSGGCCSPSASPPADVTPRLERTASGAHRLVVEKTGTFVHLHYREVSAGGPDWAAIELRADERAPKEDVAIWESTDPVSLITRRGFVSFGLGAGARLEATVAEAPRLGPRDVTAVRVCQAHDDGESGFAVVCRLGVEVTGVRAARPAEVRPLAGAWVWDVPRKGAARGARLVRIDLPLSPGGAEAGAIAFVHGARGVVVRAEATWPSKEEAPALLFTETSRTQPTSPFFSWGAPARPARR
jgi:hypothetical protein